jgi:hypothetical protein
MGSRTTEAAAPATEEAVAATTAATASPLATDALTPQGVLMLQRAIGNSATARVLAAGGSTQAIARVIHGEDVPTRPAATGAEAWTEDQVRGIQKELKRLGLYSYTIDGDRGPKTNAGLTAAFDSEAWLTMSATEAHEKLKVAKRPDDPGGTRLNYGELFKDGVLDVTFGVGYFEGNPPAEETRQVATAVMDELTKRGYTEDNDKAAVLLDKAGRPLAQKTTGRFFVKENAFTYGPPAGESRSIHSIVRVVFNDVAGGGKEAAAAFQEGMAVGDAVWYSGHGRYGTGPDFDRNFIEFRLYDKDGKLVQTLDDYVALESVLRQGGKDPWKVFQERIADKTLQVDLSNAGNVRLVGKPRDTEFGAYLINWALEQSNTKVVTGADGALGEAAAKGPQKYRVMAFYGCETNSYDAALRKTAGFDTKAADLLLTNRVTRGGADVAAFMAFLDGFVNQRSAEKMLGGMNKAMQQHENRFSGNPWVFTGLKDNPGAR